MTRRSSSRARREPVPGGLHLLGGPRHRDRRRDDGREVGEGLLAARTEGLASGQRHDEVADVLATVAERNLDRMAVRHPPRDRVAPGHVDRHRLQAHGRADVRGEPAQEVVGGLREPEVAAQGAHDVVG